jgi:hypothetical protein
MSYTPEHYVWNAMLQRCSNPNNKEYQRYGGSGITVCEAWLTSFEAFYAAMGPRPTPHHTLERLDNSKGYSPENVVWDTPKAQARNRKTTVWITHNGVTLCAKDWAVKLGVKPATLRARLREGKSIEEALFMPVRPYRT